MDLQWGIILQIIQRVCVILFMQTSVKMCSQHTHTSHSHCYECLCSFAVHPVRHVQILRLLRAVVTG